jgi:hypothetical protein
MEPKVVMTSNTMTTRSFATAAAAPAVAASPMTTHAIPTGSWTVYFHEPEDKTWTLDSYKRVHSVSSWETLGAVLRELGSHRITNGMLFTMKGDTSPLWENKANIRGGSYCLKVSRRSASEIYQRYLAAAAAGIATTKPENAIVGVTMSPKKGFCIIKLWNASSKAFNNPSDVVVLHEEIKTEEILYRPHTDQKM